jgi:hypothetical protein
MKEHHSSTIAITGVKHSDQPITDTNVHLDSRHRANNTQTDRCGWSPRCPLVGISSV